MLLGKLAYIAIYRVEKLQKQMSTALAWPYSKVFCEATCRL